MKANLMRGSLLLVFSLSPLSVLCQGAPAGGSTELYRNGTAVVVSDGGKEWLCLNGYSPGHAGGSYISEKKPGCTAGWQTVAGAAAFRLDVTNQKLDALIAELRENTKAATESRSAMKEMATKMNDAIQEIVRRKFDTLPADLLNHDVFKAKLQQLKEEIVKEVRDLFPDK